jgi:type I restriction enzyme, S subunit
MEDVCTLHYGKALTIHNRTVGHIPVYGTNGICGWHSHALGRGPTVILGRKGMGNLGVEWCAGDFWVIDTAYYTTFPRKTYPRFFYYYVNYVGLNHLKDGTSNPSLTRETFAQQPFPLPSYAEQRAIASILRALDDKIELNRRMNETLEALARAIFKSWFLDFDPVRAKAEGGKPFGMDEGTAALFPDRFGPDGLPAEWVRTSLAELTKVFARGIAPSYVAQGGIAVINQRCVRERRLDLSKVRRHDQTRRSITGREVRLGDILINSTGQGTLGRVAYVVDLPEPAIVDGHVTMVRADTSRVLSSFLGIDLTCREAEIEALGEGSTGQTELGRIRLGETELVVPPLALQQEFDSVVGPMTSQEALNNRQSATLAELRNFLLPRLMSGEIRLRGRSPSASIDHE